VLMPVGTNIGRGNRLLLTMSYTLDYRAVSRDAFYDAQIGRDTTLIVLGDSSPVVSNLESAILPPLYEPPCFQGRYFSPV